MALDDHPLLNEPHLTLVALKCASAGPAGVDEGLHRLLLLLGHAGEEPPTDRDALRDMLARAFHRLYIAGLVDLDDDRFVATRRGHETLHEHPAGIDDSVLMAFPEFRTYIRRRRVTATVVEPRLQYAEGYAVFGDGGALTDNPYEFDSIAHLEWENGWCEARDETAPPPPHK